VRAALAAVVFASVLACGSEPSAPPAAKPAPAPTPALTEPAPEGVAVPPAPEDRGFVGVIAPVEAVDVAPPFNGKLTAVHARPGDRVTAGQVLAEVEPKPLREELAMAAAALRAAKAGARQARVDVRDAERQVKSEKRAVAEGVSPKRQYEEALYTLERARAAAAGASAAVAEAEARVDSAKNRLDDTAVRAPFAGTVAMRLRDRGADTGPGAPVVRLLGEGGLRVRFAVPPEDARRFTPSTAVSIDVEGTPGPLRGTVRQVSPELDGPSRMIFVEAELETGDAPLQPGLPARVRLAQ
jgi:RND family efflux transporter MFP subunit